MHRFSRRRFRQADESSSDEREALLTADHGARKRASLASASASGTSC